MDSLRQKQVSDLQVIQDLPNVVVVPKTRAQVQNLQDECAMFTYYLLGRWPTPYVKDKYSQAHTVSHMFENVDSSSFDRFLLTMASKHSLGTRLADAYTAVFCKSSIFRKKMILLMAILESCAPTYSEFDSPDLTSKLVLVMKLLQKGCAFGLSFLLATILLFPTQIGFSVLSGSVFRGE